MPVTAEIVREAQQEMAAELPRAERDRLVSRLGLQLAYRAAKRDVETLGALRPGDRAGEGIWYHSVLLTGDARDNDHAALHTAVRYLELRRLLRHHPSDALLVQVKDWP